MVGNVEVNKRFSLEEILSNSEEWEKAIATRVWQKHVKSNPLWGKACNLNERMERVESKLVKIDNKLSEILIVINGRG